MRITHISRQLELIVNYKISSSYGAKIKSPGQSQKENFPLEWHFFALSFQNTDGHLIQ